jgi:hypothetical protein
VRVQHMQQVKLRRCPTTLRISMPRLREASHVAEAGQSNHGPIHACTARRSVDTQTGQQVAIKVIDLEDM